MIYKALKEIINKKIIIPINQEKKNITIKEADPSARLKRIIINGFTEVDRFIAFTLDYRSFSMMSPYLEKSRKHIHKGCDAVIITEIENEKYIFFCELKSDSPKGYKSQFLSSHAFIDYIESLTEKFFDCSINAFKKIYLLFTSKRLPIGTVHRPSQKKPNDWINDIPLFIEGNCRRGSIPDFINIKKYIR
jgi:hypothetical protein